MGTKPITGNKYMQNGQDLITKTSVSTVFSINCAQLVDGVFTVSLNKTSNTGWLKNGLSGMRLEAVQPVR